MDTQGFHHSPVKPQRSSSSINGFPILAISIIGILTTSLLLLSYYVFVIKCCINRRHPDVNLPLSWPQSRRHDPSRSSSSSSSSRLLGLSESTIRAIPSFRYREHRDDGARHGRRLHECAVCLNEFREEQRIRLLPRCRHVFHIDCIDTWLQSNANCPLCRSSATTAAPIERFIAPVDVHHGSGVAASRVEDGDGRGLAQAPEKSEQGKRLLYLVSKGDECINVRSRSDEEEEMFCVQPMRRSFSVDSSGDKQLHVAHQKILQLSAESSGGSSSGHRRPFFSFGRSSERAVLPVKIEL